MLHASLLVVDDAAIALTGDPGAGKSTTTATFVGRGHAALSDDLAALTVGPQSVMANPGLPALRAFPDSATAAGHAPTALASVFVDERLQAKRRIPLSVQDGTFVDVPLPLRAVYHLTPRRRTGGPAVIEPLTTRLALPMLLQNTYAVRVLDAPRRTKLVTAMAAVASAVPARTVQAADHLTSLAALVDAIVADARRALA
jgi:hypothetical protein